MIAPITCLLFIGETTAAVICNDVSKIIVEELWDSKVISKLPRTSNKMEALQRLSSFPFAFAAVGKSSFYLYRIILKVAQLSSTICSVKFSSAFFLESRML